MKITITELEHKGLPWFGGCLHRDDAEPTFLLNTEHKTWTWRRRWADQITQDAIALRSLLLAKGIDVEITTTIPVIQDQLRGGY